MLESNDTLARKVKSLRDNVLQMKSSQYSGAGNTVAYIYETSDTWDLNETATTTGGSWYGKYGNVRIIFKAKNNPAAAISFEVDCLVNNQPFYNLSPTDFNYILGTGFISQSEGNKDLAKYISEINIAWGANTGYNVKMKVRVSSLDQGTLSIVKETFGS